MRPMHLVLLLLLVPACGGDSDPADLGMGTINGIDTSQQGIVRWLGGRAYADWTAEPAVHASAGPHGQVRTFFSPELRDSLAAGAAAHPRGAVSVKELYEADGTTLAGHAVMIKAAEGAGRDTWLYYEGFLPEYRAADAFYGLGHGSCHGCHAAGRDYVLTALP